MSQPDEKVFPDEYEVWRLRTSKPEFGAMRCSHPMPEDQARSLIAEVSADPVVADFTFVLVRVSREAVQ